MAKGKDSRLQMRLRILLAIVVLFSIALAVTFDISTFAQSGSSLAAILQERLNQHISEEDKNQVRFESFQALMQAQTKENERRFTALETLAESNTWWLRAIGASIVLIAIKEILLLRNRKESVEDEP